MSFQPGNNLLTQNAGLSPENLEVPTIQSFAPSSSNIASPGKRWLYLNNAEYVNLGNSSIGGVLASNWVTYTAASSDLETLSDQSATTVTPSSNNIQLNGTAGQITTTAGSAEITWSFPSAVTMPGSLATTTTLAVGTNATVAGTLGVTGATTLAALSGTTATFSSTLHAGGAVTFGSTVNVTGLTTLAALTQIGTTLINASGSAVSTIGTGGTGAVHIGNATGNTAVTGSLTTTTTLTATLGNITATNGNLAMGTAGNKLIIPATSNATCSAGTFVLGGGATTVVDNSAVTANSIIILTTQALGTVSVASTLAVTSTIASTSFTVTPSQETDTSTVAYLIIN